APVGRTGDSIEAEAASTKEDALGKASGIVEPDNDRVATPRRGGFALREACYDGEGKIGARVRHLYHVRRGGLARGGPCASECREPTSSVVRPPSVIAHAIFHLFPFLRCTHQVLCGAREVPLHLPRDLFKKLLRLRHSRPDRVQPFG